MEPISQHDVSRRQTYNRQTSYSALGPEELLDSASNSSFHETKTAYDKDARASVTALYQDDVMREVSKHEKPRLLRDWFLELIACLVSIIALFALVITLHAYSEKPTPDWPKWLSLNTIVSIYSGLLKYGIVFVTAQGLGQLKWLWFGKKTHSRPLSDLIKYDDATRGPIGALSLLWRLKVSHVLASLAALIMTLTLLVEPFTQQMIHYYDCTIPASTALQQTIPRTNFFDEDIGVKLSPLLTAVVPGVQSAVTVGLSGPDKNPSFSCETGNCTWSGEYSSVAWCSTCVDISDSLLVTDYDTLSSVDDEDNNATNQYLSITSLPGGGITLNVSADNEAWWDLAAMAQSSLSSGSPGVTFNFVLAQKPASYGGTNAWDPITKGPFPFCNSSPANETLWQCKGSGASQCQLYPCVKTFSASAEASRLDEKLLDNSTAWSSNVPEAPQDPFKAWNNVDAEYVFSMVDTDCINDGERQALQKLGYNIQSSGRWLPYNLTFDLTIEQEPNAAFPASMAVKNCVYAVGKTFLDSLTSYVVDAFNGTLSYEPILSRFAGPEPIQTIFNFGNVSFDQVNDVFNNISISLTNFVRQNGGANNSDPVIGTAYLEKTCIQVQWPWVAFPAALVAFNLVLFISLVIQTRPSSNPLHVWKSSPLPLLHSGIFLRDELYGITEGVYTGFDLQSMSARAEKTRVKLGQDLRIL